MIRGRFRDFQSWRLWLRVAITVLVAIGLATFIGAWWVLTSTWKLPGDQLAALGDVFAAGALVLALVAGIVATFAYGVAIEQPDLRAVLRVPHSDVNVPVLVIDPTRAVGGEVPARVIVNNGQENWQVQLENRSAYTGRNPLVRIEFMNLWSLSGIALWTVVTPMTAGAKAAIRWSGGVDNSVHGNDVADLPILNLRDLIGGAEGEHRLVVHVLAEGFRRIQVFPVEFVTPAQWREGHPERNAFLPDHLKA